MKSLQDQYKLITEGKGHKDVFLKEAKRLYPNLLTNSSNFKEAETILKNKGIISENIVSIPALGSLKDESKKDWISIFNENINENKTEDELLNIVMRYVKDPDDAFTQTDFIISGDIDKVDDAVLANLERDPDYKAWKKKTSTLNENIENDEPEGYLKDPHDLGAAMADIEKGGDAEKFLKDRYDKGAFMRSIERRKKLQEDINKEIEDINAHGYDNADKKNLDNQIFDQYLNGLYVELKKDPELTMEKAREIVAKNLASDPIYYTKNAAFKVDGIGYTDEAPGLTPKEITGKYKASGYGDLKEALDYNDPVLMKMRADQSKPKSKEKSSKEKKLDRSISNLIKDLERLRAKTIEDMGKEAKSEGDPIFDEYKEKLNKIDKMLDKLNRGNRIEESKIKLRKAIRSIIREELNK